MARPASRAKKQEDIGSIVIPQGMAVKAEIKSPEDKAEKFQRLKMEVWSFWIKEALVYVFALVILLTTAVYCFWVLWHPGSSMEEKHWVMSTLTSLLVGIVGYVFGKVTK